MISSSGFELDSSGPKDITELLFGEEQGFPICFELPFRFKNFIVGNTREVGFGLGSLGLPLLFARSTVFYKQLGKKFKSFGSKKAHVKKIKKAPTYMRRNSYIPSLNNMKTKKKLSCVGALGLSTCVGIAT